jgi:predicted deacylase
VSDRFNPQMVPPATKMVLTIDIAPLASGPMLQLPVLVARGREPGKTVVVLGGVHGDEYEGMMAVREVYRGLDLWELNGTFIGVPVCNPPAFSTHSRTSPLDGQNLARVFPGRPDGTVSEITAHILTEAVISRADFLIDLHSSGSFMAMALLAGYFKGDNEQARISREAAMRFGLPLIWGHESVADGRSLTPAHRMGIPWIYTECPAGGRLNPEYAEAYANGVRNVMRYLGILSGEATVTEPLRELAGEGDTDKSLAAPVGGFLRSHVGLLDEVAAGDLLGVVEDLAGTTLAEIRAPSRGTVIVHRFSPSVNAGDSAFLLT